VGWFVSNRGSRGRKRVSRRVTPRREQPSEPRTATSILPPESRIGCANVLVWLLAMASFGFSETISDKGDTSIVPFGLIFVLPCWALTYANRRRVVYPAVPAMIAFVAVILGLVELLTGWSWLPVSRISINR
jgi:hypothetical protein